MTRREPQRRGNARGGAFFFTPYPVCAAAGTTARAAPKLIATTKILVTFISRN